MPNLGLVLALTAVGLMTLGCLWAALALVLYGIRARRGEGAAMRKSYGLGRSSPSACCG